MRKILVLLIVACFAAWGFSSSADASIFIDFEAPEFSLDSSMGDTNHTYSSPYGDINFNGRIWWKLDGSAIPDNTLGDATKSAGWFLKNNIDSNQIEMTFDFPVTGGSFYIYGLSDLQDVVGAESTGIMYYGEAWAGSTLVQSGSFEAGRSWSLIGPGTLSQPVDRVVLWSSDSSGNNFAIDDITIETIPEPATMSLLGMGLMGLIGIRRKRS